MIIQAKGQGSNTDVEEASEVLVERLTDTSERSHGPDVPIRADDHDSAFQRYAVRLVSLSTHIARNRDIIYKHSAKGTVRHRTSYDRSSQPE